MQLKGSVSMTEVMAFEGFPKQAFQFFRDIGANNNREWFQANKQDYIDTVQTPAVSFLVAMGEQLKSISPGITYDTRTNGAGSLMRIYRDIRFSKDKSPYKTHIGMNLWEGPTKKETPGYHFWMDQKGGAVYGGFHAFPKPFIAAYREAVAADASGEKLAQAVGKIGSSEGFEIRGEQLKRVPPGYEQDHPRGDLLRYKGLFARGPTLTPNLLQSAEAVDICFEHARVLAPLHKWFVAVHQQLRD
jgi:uncharacterized protein (TIGR02453 family)